MRIKRLIKSIRKMLTLEQYREPQMAQLYQNYLAIIMLAAIATPIAKSQHMREIWFYVMSSGVMLKIVVMEIARIIQMF